VAGGDAGATAGNRGDGRPAMAAGRSGKTNSIQL